MTIGEIIEEYRKEHNISQREFAKLSGLTNGYISMLEKGSNPKTGEPIVPTIKSLKAIADAIGIPLDKLMASDDFKVILSEDELATASGDEFDALLLTLFRKLPSEKQKEAIQHIRNLVAQVDTDTVPP